MCPPMFVRSELITELVYFYSRVSCGVDLLLPRPSRRGYVGLGLLGLAASHKQKHSAALVDLQHLVVGTQSDFAKWRCSPGTEDGQAIEPVGPARIYGEKPKRLRMVSAVNRAAAWGSPILPAVS